MKLNDFLHLTPDQINDTKMHCAIGHLQKERDSPLIEFYNNRFKEWQECQNNKNFERKYILSLIYCKPDEWLYAGIYERLSVVKGGDCKFLYDTKLSRIGEEFIGRLMIYFRKEFRQSYLILENYIEDLDIIEYLREKKTILPFNGYENVNLSYQELSTIIHNDIESWKTALSSVKGVYIITDKTNGKHYIGSAYGTDSFWQRWSDYIRSLHGYNKSLREKINEKGKDYVHNFQFSILEIRSTTTDNEEIIQRESFWKNVFLTREHGYNEN